MKSKYLKEIKFDGTKNESGECEEQNDHQQTEIGPKCIAVHKNRTKFQQQDMYVPWHNKRKTENGNVENKKTFHRFYHVFKKGELESLFKKIDNVKILESYYDDGNWCVIAQKM